MSDNPVHEDGALIPAVNRLHDTISKLIDPRRVALDHGHTWLDPLLQELFDSVAGQSVEQKSGGPARAPLWAEACQLAWDIDRQASKWHPAVPQSDETVNLDRVTLWRLQRLSDAKWRPQDCDHITRIADQCENWAHKIAELLCPEPVVYLPKPCPICGTESVKRRDSGGELVNQRALSIRGDQGARCGHCHTRWQTVGELAILGRMIGYGSQVVICDTP